jgi:hypothetical protein
VVAQGLATVPTPRPLVLLALVGGLALAGDASAQAPPSGGSGGTKPSVPGADAFDIRYYLTDENADPLATQFGALHFTQFVNKARCECGHAIHTRVRLKQTMGNYDTTKLVETFVGAMCGTAEANPVGQFRRCARLATQTVQRYIQGVTSTFHPVWLTNGVSIESGDIRDPENAIAAGSCEGGQGESGVWMCAQTNATVGCQSDEFFISGTQNSNLGMGMSSGIKFDFLPPVEKPQAIYANPGDSAVVISWDILAQGDINGFRVLCEEADTGKPPPGKGMSRPALNVIPNGTIYYTKDNLCPNGPFSTFNAGSNSPIDPGATTATTDDGTTTGDATTDDTATTSPLYEPIYATTGGTTDTTGGTTDVLTTTDGGTTDGALCGNLVLDDGEECDDGPDNADDAECHTDCKLDVCGDGKQGPEEECDAGDANGDANLCASDCTLNVSDGLKDLDWDYVCTDHLAFNTKTVRIEGLENGKRYNFILVYYDVFGNPAAFEQVISTAPVDTRDLWEQCHALGDICGESGFCNLAGGRGDPLLGLGGLLGLGIGLGGLRRRAKRTRA